MKANNQDDMARSVALVPKLIRILRARGLSTPDSSGKSLEALALATDSRTRKLAEGFEAVEKELGCPLPEDYKELIVELPPGTCCCFAQ